MQEVIAQRTKGIIVSNLIALIAAALFVVITVRRSPSLPRAARRSPATLWRMSTVSTTASCS